MTSTDITTIVSAVAGSGSVLYLAVFKYIEYRKRKGERKEQREERNETQLVTQLRKDLDELRGLYLNLQAEHNQTKHDLAKTNLQLQSYKTTFGVICTYLEHLDGVGEGDKKLIEKLIQMTTP